MLRVCRKRKFTTKKMSYTASEYMITKSKRVVMLAWGGDDQFLVCVICKDDYTLLAHRFLESETFCKGYFERFCLYNDQEEDYLVSFKTPHCHASNLKNLIDVALLEDNDSDETVDFI